MTRSRRQMTGACEGALLRFLRHGRYVGTVPALAERVGHPERRVWLSLAGLAGRSDIQAHRVGDVLHLVITARGRARGGY